MFRHEYEQTGGGESAASPAPDSMGPRVVAVVNQKGGVGKTTTAVNLSACLAVADRRTLLVDLDPQSNATSALGIETNDPALYRALVLEEVVEEKSLHLIDIEGLMVFPSSLDLVGAELELADHPDRSDRLRRALAPVRERFQFVLIDCPPSLGLLTLNALRAADEVLIPIQAEYFALEGLARLMRTIERVRETLHPGLRVGGIVLTMYDGRTNLSRQVGEELRAHLPGLTYGAAIPRSVRLAEAPSHGKPIISYDISSAGAQAYLALASEFLMRAEQIGRNFS